MTVDKFRFLSSRLWCHPTVQSRKSAVSRSSEGEVLPCGRRLVAWWTYTSLPLPLTHLKRELSFRIKLHVSNVVRPRGTHFASLTQVTTLVLFVVGEKGWAVAVKASLEEGSSAGIAVTAACSSWWGSELAC